MDKPGQDSNAPGPGPGLDKNFLPRDQAGTKIWRSPGSRAGSRAEILTPCRDPDTNLSPAQTSDGHGSKKRGHENNIPTIQFSAEISKKNIH